VYIFIDVGEDKLNYLVKEGVKNMIAAIAIGVGLTLVTIGLLPL
jgi:hypothetical protein